MIIESEVMRVLLAFTSATMRVSHPRRTGRAQPSLVSRERVRRAATELTNTEASVRTRNVLTLVMTFALPVAVLAQGSGKTNAKSAPKPAASRLVVMPASDMKWTDLGPGAPGVKVADLWGNHANGAFGALFKLPAGFAAPLHSHTYDMKVVIMSGTYIQAPEGKPEFRLGPGSYFLQPGGTYRHTTTCDKASDCVFLVESKGPFDLKPVDAGKGPTN
jgi:quercetin dioxygenase-like cupin family protein